MKPLSPHDPLDDLIAAALHGELTPEERTQFEARLSNDPAAQAAYQEALAMHDLLEKTHQSAQPDSAFEQRMVSGVRRKLQTKQHPETALESLLALWNGVKSVVIRKRQPLPWLGSAIAILCILFVLAGVALGPITNGIKQAKGNAEMQEARQRMLAANEEQADQSQAKSVFSTVTSKLADNNDMALTAGSTSIPADKANLNGGATDSLQLAMHHSTLKRALQFAGKDQPTSSAFAAPMAPAPVEKAVALDVPSNTAAFPGNLASRDRLITEDEMKVSEVTARSKMTAADKASGTAGGAASASPDAIAAPAAPATIVSAAAPTPFFLHNFR